MDESRNQQNNWQTPFILTNRCFVPLFLKDKWLLLSFWLISETFRQFFSLTLKVAEQGSVTYFTAVGGDLMSSMLLYVALTLWAPLRITELDQNAPKASYWSFTHRHVWPLTVESLRAMAITLLWSLALILPGLFKYIRLSFVPYVVVANPKYDAGELDALSESNRLVNGWTLPLGFLFIIALGVEYWQSGLRFELPITQNPFQSIFVSAPFFFFNIYINILLFRIYQYRVFKLSKAEALQGS